MSFLRLTTTLSRGGDILHGFVTSASSKAANSVCYAAREALRDFVLEKSPRINENILISVLPPSLGSKDLPWPARISVAWTEVLQYCLGLVSLSGDGHHLDPKILHIIFATTKRAHYQSHDLRLLDAAVGVYHEI